MDRYELCAAIIIVLALAPVVALLALACFAVIQGLRQKSPTRTFVNDPVFGTIERDGDFWIALSRDQTDGFMVSIDAGDAGPSPIQQRFFSRIVSDLPRHEAAAKSIIRLESAGAEVDALSLFALEIGPDGAAARGEFVLELSDEFAEEIHRVHFEHFRPLIHDVDGN